MGTNYLLRNQISNKSTKKRSNALKTENKNDQSFQKNLGSFPKDIKYNYKKKLSTSRNPNFEDFVFLYSSVEGSFFKYYLIQL